MNFTPNEKQEKAFDKVSKAIKDAKKAGLIFYGKCGQLVAYTKQADEYVEKNGFLNCFGTMQGQIPNISMAGLIKDSGADDYPQFISDADEREFS
jgi:hypothetical protein